MLSGDDLVIVGAGPAGLATAASYPGSRRILEQEDEVGGLCRSIEFGGGVFDIGGHSFHSPDPEVIDLVESLVPGGLFWQRRDARVWVDGELIDYPFQEHFAQLSDAAVAAECRDLLPDPGRPVEADNLEDWIVQRFGAGIARHFMLPYNRKLWARDLRRLSCEWVSERIAGSASSSGGGERRRPLISKSMVGYPPQGGFVEIYRGMAQRSGPIELGLQVSRIDPARRIAVTHDGQRWPWRRLVSTMPLPALLGAIEGCPPRLIELADELEVVSLKVLLVLVSGPVGELPQRVYVADPAIPPHKVAFNHASSESLRRRPVHAVMGEIAWSADKPVAADSELERTTLGWLADAGFVNRDDVIETRWLDIHHGYPVYTARRAQICGEIFAYLEGLDIHTAGRFGRWEYINSDACIRDGLELGRRLGGSAALKAGGNGGRP